jgi:hypothetical protein
MIMNGAGQGHRGIVRGYPLGTGHDSCEWHGSGTAGEDDVRRAWQLGHYMDQRVRPDSGDACFVGKGRQPAAARQVGFEPGSMLLRRPRSERCRRSDLRFLLAGRDRW